jgi:hypothetical protein
MLDEASDDVQPVGNMRIPDYPRDFMEAVHREVRYCAVSLVAESDGGRNAVPCAGTLVVLNGTPGILTARHVWEEVERRGTLVVLLNEKSYRIDARTIAAVVPPISGRLADDATARVPDIAFLRLAQEHRGTIESCGRVFYNIDRRRKLGVMRVSSSDGFTIAAGTLEVLTDREARKVCSFNYATAADRLVEHEGWDYIYVHLNVEDNPTLPVSTFGGMSGGSVWSALIGRTASGELKLLDLNLVGVTFLETAEPGRQLVAHGPKSIYERLASEVGFLK